MLEGRSSCAMLMNRRHCWHAGIAKWDVPNDWPELLGQLVGVINERKNTSAVDGAVRCLATFVEDLDDIQLIQVRPGLSPEFSIRRLEFAPCLALPVTIRVWGSQAKWPR